MTQQPSLFSLDAYGGATTPAPMAAKADPVTSHEAAARHVASGARQRHAEIVFAVVVANPRMTGHELWTLLSDADRAELGDHHELYRRLNDLRGDGKVRQVEAKVCGVKNRRMVCWEATK